MIKMPQAVGTTGVKRPANYSHCPLKKRPIKYEHVEADYSSDSSDNNGPSLIQHDSEDSSEPENLSTKPEDLRIVNAEIKISPVSVLRKVSSTNGSEHVTVTKLKTSLHHPIAAATTTARTDKVKQHSSPSPHSQILGNCVRSSLSSSSLFPPPPQLNYGPTQQLSPLTSTSSSIRHLPIPPPPPLKVFSTSTATPHMNGNGRPLEPISFNPQVATTSASVTAAAAGGWSSSVPHYLPFNFMPPTTITTSTAHGHGHQSSRHQHQQQHHSPMHQVANHNSHSNSFSPYSPHSHPSPKSPTAYPLYGHHHQFINQSHFAPHGPHRNQNQLKSEIGSPPHISPPLNNEPSYPVMTSVRRQETTFHQQQQQRHYPPTMTEDLTKFNLHHHHHQQHQLQQNHYKIEITPKEVKREIRELQSSHSLPLPSSLHKREALRNSSSKKLQQHSSSTLLNRSHISHHHHHSNDIVNRSRSLSSGSCSDRSSPIPDSSSLSPCSSTTGGGGSSSNGAVTSTIIPTNVNGSIRYQCPDCNKSYSTFSGLSKHLQFHCASQNKKSFICKFCDKVYVSLGALKMHIRTHTLPCKCTICGKAFSRPWLLQGHIRTHTGEKPFSCDFCHRAFADRSNLRAHLQTHSEVKKYSCQSCSKTFSRTSLLAKHKDSGCGHGSA